MRLRRGSRKRVDLAPAIGVAGRTDAVGPLWPAALRAEVQARRLERVFILKFLHQLRHDLLGLARRYDRNGDTGPIAITADYLETVIVRA